MSGGAASLSPRRFLPEGARAKRDRGAGLYVSDAPVDSPFFDCRPLKRGWRLLPAPELLGALEAEAGEPSGALLRSLARFRGMAAEPESIALFCEGAKLLEAPEPSRMDAWDMRLRRRAAVCLRAGGGGGLYACALLQKELFSDWNCEKSDEEAVL